MFIKQIAVLLYATVGFVGNLTSADIEPTANSISGPPELGVAIAVDDNTIEVHRFIVRTGTRVTTPDVPQGVTFEGNKGTTFRPAPKVEQISVIETYTTRFDVTKVVARRIDGSVVYSKILVNELAKPTPIIYVKQGQKVDQFFSKMFKPESLVLLLPSSLTPPTNTPSSTTPMPPTPQTNPTGSITPMPQIPLPYAPSSAPAP
jgi:hypothetical protein